MAKRQIALASYKLSANKNFASDVDEVDLFKVLEERLVQRSTDPDKNETDQQVYLTADLQRPEVRRLRGLVRMGDYGVARQHMDVDTFEITEGRSPKKAELNNFYFDLLGLKNVKHCILLLQRTGVYGVSTVLEEDLKKHFRSQWSKRFLGFTVLTPPGYREAIISGEAVKSVEYIAHVKPENIENRELDRTSHRQVGGKVKIQYMPARNRFLRIAQAAVDELLRGEIPTGSLLEIEINPEGFEAEEIKITTEYKGRPRTIVVGRNQFGRAYEPVEVEWDTNGEPIFESLAAKADTLLGELVEGLVEDED